MPNWVHNTLTIHSTDMSIIEQFTKPHEECGTDKYFNFTDEIVVKEGFSFQNIVPVPRETWGEYYSKSDGSETANNWYHWNNRNWGTKWDAKDPVIDKQESCIVIEFDTAWSPPEPVMSKLAQILSDVEIEYKWQEEQGFGEEQISEAGHPFFVTIRSWDIPESHGEMMEVFDYCHCSWGEELVFDDCTPLYDNKVEE